MRFLPVNLDALLVELDDLQQTLALHASLRRDPIAGIEELVPAARTVLVRYRPAAQGFAALVDAIARRDVRGEAQRSDTLVEIPVRYDGEDLAEVAQRLGITPDEVVRRHTGSEYTVAFTGFAPGFGYLAGGDPGLDVPRRATPRTRIPAGAVGLAGTFSGVYPQASPGGWQIIGTTPVAMWDIDRDPPALLQPGARVRFVDIATLPASAREALEAVKPAAPSASGSASATPDTGAQGPALRVLSAGLQTLFQDLGRHGHAGQGVSASGAMDRAACRAANRLAGNPSDTACLETVQGGLRLRSQGENVVAVAGADAPLWCTAADGRRWPLPRYAPVALADGDELAIGEPHAGARCYVAVRGGFRVMPVLGSCATDTLARVGPPAVAAGDVLPVRVPQGLPAVGAAELPPDGLPRAGGEVVLDCVPGPRTDWFTPEALALLASQRWQVTPQSNRVGLRLAGDTALARAVQGELPSEGAVAGAIQVPPSGQPVLFLADHPLTGGYPVIGAVAPHHLDLAGQIPVNAWVRFRPIRAFEPVTRP
ncbi:5-oxoprolinase subunit PxpB [Paracidovorax citrulli]|uniref:Allophanate hydrolase subunit 2 n=2 Tax=Paracidovorax citrulli TaxID=80869 RepID=A1TSX8_PARC0|nr:5-oxoprolinase subunit PxpB [Paracidovorax citrulli]ABM34066.1 Allophanate hydrolase subunit 2 [Paracidovorax citrulli AAC00-1]ATG93583.1 allophanate hydrolase [Paracidovorax citrulli]PVY63504.1 KipI family sensor histidine kinase inhibitor [Paracidovorax citrulli]QCX09502.1 Kinase A inhibitor [Paracidovorax citrulli]REG67529.1 KipI family sensor histidine kinase inhibitor [Paracidovorax citrulli]